MNDAVFTCRKHVGEILSFCLNHLNHESKLKVLVPRAGLTVFRGRSAAYFFKYLKSLANLLCQYGQFPKGDLSYQRQSNDIPRNRTCRISCRGIFAYFFNSCIKVFNFNLQHRYIWGNSEVVQTL